MIRPSNHGANGHVPFLAYGLYIIANNVLYATGHTGTIGTNVLMAALLNAGLNVLWIPWLGAMGAALATLGAYTVLAGWSMWVAERKMPVGYPWGAPNFHFVSSF